MKNWMTRFATLAAVVAVMGSALMVGCSNGDSETTETTAPDGSKTKTTVETDD